MRNAATILSIIRERGKRGLPLEDVYRQLFNPDLYRLAYGKIYRNQGAMTPGATPETVDGMSLDKIQNIIGLLREERYRFSPARRTYIEKKNSTKKRPLGLPTWSDKLLQEVIRLLLEAYYDPQFSNHSHGFRHHRGCHSALTEIERTWRGTAWFIEGDIKGCFDNLDHSIFLGILREKIRDNRFLRLIENLLQAGYLEEWKYNATHSGSPQGGIVSPLLANIYLDRLDRYVEEHLLPNFNRGNARRRNPEFESLNHRWHYLQRRGRIEEAKQLHRQVLTLPAKMTDDPDYRRLRYIRYADDFLLGFAGPRHEAEEIKARLKEFLQDTLKLELSETKTLITHGRSQAARFLGYDLRVLHNDTYRAKDGSRKTNGNIGLFVPAEVVRARCQRYMKGGKPSNRPELLRDSEYSILLQYQYEYRGFANYYQLAVDRSRKLPRLKWVMETSLTQTLANKFRTKVTQVYRRFATTLETEQGCYKVLQTKVEREGKAPLVATWGGISLARVKDKKMVILKDAIKPDYPFRTEIVTRLLNGERHL
ncbi:MAG TPA: reverse transcriptase domain-containing protein [Abditibacteriaceae bacterium]|jgi:group II intron reverse transcriptase/maturase